MESQAALSTVCSKNGEEKGAFRDDNVMKDEAHRRDSGKLEEVNTGITSTWHQCRGRHQRKQGPAVHVQ